MDHPSHPAQGTFADPLISIRAGALVIKHYYFPTGTRRIPVRSMRAVRRYPITSSSGRRRYWGSGDTVHWFNLDPHRAHKEYAVVIDVGRRAKPVVTPDNPELFEDVLAQHGITTSH